MSAFYDDMAQVAANLIAEYGQSVVLTYSQPGAYDTATGKTTAGSVSIISAIGIQRAYRAREIDGSMIQQGDNRLVLSPFDGDGQPLSGVKVNGRVEMADGSTWTVVSVEPISPAGKALVFVIQLRR